MLINQKSTLGSAGALDHDAAVPRKRITRSFPASSHATEMKCPMHARYAYIKLRASKETQSNFFFSWLSMEGGELFSRIQEKQAFTERGE